MLLLFERCDTCLLFTIDVPKLSNYDDNSDKQHEIETALKCGCIVWRQIIFIGRAAQRIEYIFKIKASKHVSFAVVVTSQKDTLLVLHSV